MHLNVGSGKYWKILFYVSICGIVGNIVECIGVINTCLKGKENETGIVIPFILEEFTCFFKEYSVPVLNLVKMKAYSKGKLSNIVKYVIIFLAIPFAYCRFTIGYERMTNGVLKTRKTEEFHGYAFAVMGFADFICTVSIFYFVRKFNKEVLVNNDINHYIKHSSYVTLIFIDIDSMILSILQILNGKIENFPSCILNPFRDVKTGFLLILAVDAFVFKYNVHTNTILNQSNDTYIYGKDSTDNASANFRQIFASNLNGTTKNTDSTNGIMNGITNNIICTNTIMNGMTNNNTGSMNGIGGMNGISGMNGTGSMNGISSMNGSIKINNKMTTTSLKNKLPWINISTHDFSSLNNINETDNIQSTKVILKGFDSRNRQHSTSSINI
ncbi:hypothetical protein LY90DRAFT_516165 [Neocallimastix californiae]|uniref:Uncharacterized protein n=1 Tax=Neocallimastix californiae TaxID=1754190 RepID=A0A1Y2AGE1_9FUNG|nr:hypothetical protein LY90DRAFT_516165 [Neocallimastix californiae]|eukprot:ORY21360.1 hypothetical protein LY90DRAFT_516165 [Neocallimastix californiae]